MSIERVRELRAKRRLRQERGNNTARAYHEYGFAPPPEEKYFYQTHSQALNTLIQHKMGNQIILGQQTDPNDPNFTVFLRMKPWRNKLAFDLSSPQVSKEWEINSETISVLHAILSISNDNYAALEFTENKFPGEEELFKEDLQETYATLPQPMLRMVKVARFNLGPSLAQDLYLLNHTKYWLNHLSQQAIELSEQIKLGAVPQVETKLPPSLLR